MKSIISIGELEVMSVDVLIDNYIIRDGDPRELHERIEHYYSIITTHTDNSDLMHLTLRLTEQDLCMTYNISIHELGINTSLYFNGIYGVRH